MYHLPRPPPGGRSDQDSTVRGQMPRLPLGHDGTAPRRTRAAGSADNRVEISRLPRGPGKRVYPMPHASRADGLLPPGPDRPLHPHPAPRGGATEWGHLESHAMSELFGRSVGSPRPGQAASGTSDPVPAQRYARRAGIESTQSVSNLSTILN